MEEDFLWKFVEESTAENNKLIEEQNRINFFKRIGKKGGLKTKEKECLVRRISVRFSNLEFEKIKKEADKNNISISEFIRLISTETELKVKEFSADKILLEYGNNFQRITNLLRNREWTEFENKKEILNNISLVTNLIRDYLYQKNNKNE